MLITLFEWMWVLSLAVALGLLGTLRLFEHKNKHHKPKLRWLWRLVKVALISITGISLIGVYLTTIPAKETFTYTGGMSPVSEKFNDDFPTPFHYVYVQNGFINHEGQRFFLNLAHFTMPHLSFSPRSGTVYAYRTAQENQIVGLNSQRESYDNMILAAYEYAGQPLEYTTTYTILTTYKMFSSASELLQSGDQLVAYDGIQMTNRTELDRYIRQHATEEITLELLRAEKPVTVTVQLEDPFGYGGLHTLGFAIAENKQYTLPEETVSLPEKMNHSGGSSGLLMALQMISLIKEPGLGDGFTIAGTGGINAQGEVTTIGSLYHKIATVSREGADIFLVPKAQEQEALRYQKELDASNVTIIGVATLAEAVDSIKTWTSQHQSP